MFGNVISRRGFFKWLCVTALALAAGTVTVQHLCKENMEAQRLSAKEYGESIAATIRISLDRSLKDTEFLEAIYRSHGNTIEEGELDEVCKFLMERNSTIGSLYIAPDDVVAYAYPESVRESTMGFSARKDPKQAEKAYKAIGTGEITVAGPAALIEGGVGFIIRNPMFGDAEKTVDSFEGFTIVILDWEKFVKKIQDELPSEESGYVFAVWKDEDAYAEFDENGFIFKGCEHVREKYIDIPFEVPNDTWHMTVQPKEGYSYTRGMEWAFAGIGIILFLTVAGSFMYISGKEHRRKILTDLNENRERAALAESRQLMIEVIHKTLHSGMWGMEFDEDGKMVSVDWSDEFRRMLGYLDEWEFPNKLESWSDLLHADDKERVLKEFYDTIADYSNRKSYDVEYRLQTKDGEWRWYHAMGRLTRREDGSPRSYVGIFIDITRNKQKDALLHDALKQAKAASEAKTAFLSSMSHDIRTPMNGIVGMVAIAQRNLGNPERVEDCLNKITTASNHLLGLINEILDMSKIESGKVELQAEPIDLPAMLEDVVDMVRPQIATRGHTLVSNDVTLTHKDVVGDRMRLQQVFLNLLGNAIKYTPDGGTITLRAHEKPTRSNSRGCFEFVFEDNGIGMSEEFLEHLYEPFARADDKRTTEIQGTGLGMTITINIIQMMGGTIDVKSELNKGTRFVVTLYMPLLERKESEGEAGGGARRAVSLDAMDLSGSHILVAEDMKLNAEIALELLRSTGAEADWAKNGKLAVERFTEAGEGYYSLILMDIRMPQMNGHEATKAIRALDGDYAKTVPIVAMTADAFSEDVRTAKENGMNDHLAKPIDLKALARILQAYVIERGSGTDETAEARAGSAGEGTFVEKEGDGADEGK